MTVGTPRHTGSRVGLGASSAADVEPSRRCPVAAGLARLAEDVTSADRVEIRADHAHVLDLPLEKKDGAFAVQSAPQVAVLEDHGRAGCRLPVRFSVSVGKAPVVGIGDRDRRARTAPGRVPPSLNPEIAVREHEHFRCDAHDDADAPMPRDVRFRQGRRVTALAAGSVVPRAKEEAARRIHVGSIEHAAYDAPVPDSANGLEDRFVVCRADDMAGEAVPHAAHRRSVVQLHSGADCMVGGRRNIDLKEPPAESVVELHAEVPLPTAAGEPGGPCPPDRFRPLEGAALRVVEDLVVAGGDGSAGSPGDGYCGIRSEHRARHEPQVALDLNVGSDPVRPGTYQRARAGRQAGKGLRVVIRPIARGSVGLPQERERQRVARGQRRLPVRRGVRPARDADAPLVSASAPGAERSSELPKAPRRR